MADLEKLLNGAGPAPEIMIYQIPTQGGAKLRFVTSHGRYLGSIEFDAVDAQALLILGSQFQGYAAQQTGSIQIATAAPGLRTS